MTAQECCNNVLGPTSDQWAKNDFIQCYFKKASLDPDSQAIRNKQLSYTWLALFMYNSRTLSLSPGYVIIGPVYKNVLIALCIEKFLLTLPKVTIPKLVVNEDFLFVAVTEMRLSS